MTMIARQSMTLFMLAVFTIMVVIALSYPEGARFMPLTVGIPGILLCCLQIALDFRKKADGAEEEKDEIREAELKAAKLVGHNVEFGHAAVIDAPKDRQEEVRREFITWIYFLGFLGGILLFGFWVSIPIFLFAFLKERARATWTKSITLTCIATTAFYFIFAKGLGVSLYTGMLTGLIMDRIAG
jgi:hypothetical protein